jgi:phosphatidylserine/phosphatidylglycerophosphate/cardiolipin synthase-like enzyme
MNNATVSLIVQPGDGIVPLMSGITNARQNIQIVIFKFDAGEIEKALTAAAKRGVFVHAMIAHSNGKDEGALRKLEMRLLEQGITVARTDSDLLRYHDKMMIIDQQTLYLLGFNYTAEDIERSRSFGIVTSYEPWIREATKLFIADATRQPYTPEVDTFLVSPVNARQGLSTFLAGARRQILIYDKKVEDEAMIALLLRQARAGVDVRIIGEVATESKELQVVKLANLRLHTRTIIRDGEQAFNGSQSLRGNELDARREVGVIVSDAAVVNRLHSIFETDWAEATTGKRRAEKAARAPSDYAAVAQAFLFHRRPVPAAMAQTNNDEVTPSAETLLPEMLARAFLVHGSQIPAGTQEANSQVFKEAVKEMVREVISENAKDSPESTPLKEVVRQAIRDVITEEISKPEEAPKTVKPSKRPPGERIQG